VGVCTYLAFFCQVSGVSKMATGGFSAKAIGLGFQQVDSNDGESRCLAVRTTPKLPSGYLT
jgi:hypothetical protein